MMSQPGIKITAIHILPNISRSKGNQTMKFGQLIEYNYDKYLTRKIVHKIWWRNWSQTFLLKIKI